MMKYIVDRVEDGKLAVCFDENGEMLVIGLENLPEDVSEGSVIIKNGNGFSADKTAEKQIRKNNFAKASALFSK